MKRLLLLSVFLLFLSCEHTKTDQVAENTLPSSKLVGVYHYIYPDNTADLIEDCYLVLERDSNMISGRYYGTTDEFEDDREGYSPGFFVADIENFSLNDDTLTFAIQVDSADIFTSPIPLSIHSAKQAHERGLVKWGTRRWLKMEKTYKGIIQDDSLYFKGTIPLFDKHFCKIEE